MPLEAKIPPPVVAAAIAAAMWALAGLLPQVGLPATLRWAVGITLLAMATTFSMAGVLAIRRARTTLNPTRPEEASALVSSGIYRVTRNPMYLGLCTLLMALAAFLSSAWALLGPVAFVLYTNRFQILPEERALTALFGGSYAAYQARVRRWL